MRCSFVVTVDVEADDEWTCGRAGEYSNIEALPRFQELCNRYHVRPTYLVTFDVASHRGSARILRELGDGGGCEIGAHMHPWRTPPFDAQIDGDTAYRPYLYDYPEQIQAEKMQSLTRLLHEVFERPVTSHRAGRWGIDAHGCDLLEQNGYIVDTSVTPLLDRTRSWGHPSGNGGPNFIDAPCEPYHPSKTDVVRQGRRELLEIPVSTGGLGAMASLVEEHTMAQLVSGQPPIGDVVRRVLGRLGLFAVILLNPARHEFSELGVLVDRLIERRARVINLAIHSSELIAGASPQVDTAQKESAVWQRLESLFQTVTCQDHVRSLDLSRAATELMDERTPDMVPV